MKRFGYCRVTALTCAVLALAGCDGTIHRTTVLSDGAYSILATDARQRLVIAGTRVGKDGRTKKVICAEPSPDAIVAAASYFGGNANFQQGPADAQQTQEGSVGAGVSEAVGNIGLRTQTIQLLRDGYYRICEAYLNGAIEEFDYQNALRAIDRFMVALVGIEAVAGAPVNIPLALTTNITVTPGAEQDPEEIELNAAVHDAAVAEAMKALAQAGTTHPHQSQAVRDIVYRYFEIAGRMNPHALWPAPTK